MKVHNDLKKLLEEYTHHAVFWICCKEKGNTMEVVNDFLASNSLASVEPEPLAKNKDCESDFECPKDKSICRMYGTYYCNRLCDLT